MSMQAIHAIRFGGPDVLVEAEAPEPDAGPGQVVVAVSVAEVLFIDTQLRSGWGEPYFALEPPCVPGTGVAGTVIAAGEGVDPGLVGRQVIARTGNTGGYAQRAVALAEEVFEMPDGLDPQEALASLHDGYMALAHAAGAYVIATALGERKPGLARRLGADIAVDYSEATWPERVAAGRIRPVIGRTFPLGQAGAAHTAIEARGVSGKTLLPVAAS